MKGGFLRSFWLEGRVVFNTRVPGDSSFLHSSRDFFRGVLVFLQCFLELLLFGIILRMFFGGYVSFVACFNCLMCFGDCSKCFWRMFLFFGGGFMRLQCLVAILIECLHFP